MQNRNLQAQIDKLMGMQGAGKSPVPATITDNLNNVGSDAVGGSNELFNRGAPRVGAGAVAAGTSNAFGLALSPRNIRSVSRDTNTTEVSSHRRGSNQTDTVSNVNQNLFWSEQLQNERRKNKNKNSETGQDATTSLNVGLTKQIIIEVLQECNLIPHSRQLNVDGVRHVTGKQANSRRDHVPQSQTVPQVRSYVAAVNSSPASSRGTNYALIAGKQGQNVNVNDHKDFPQLGTGNRR